MITVDRVDPQLTYPLRQQVLRPHQGLASVMTAGDRDPAGAAFAARTADGTVVGTAVVRPEECPWRPGEPGAWRLRGMATAPELRGQGIGALVLRAAIAHISVNGGKLVWCNARTPALRFYEREGFRTHGDQWVDPQIGPHVAMWLPLGERALS
jgi:GNAT superfamily N-acetyltransferase